MVSRISRPQIAKIWALARELGLDREALYQLVPGGSMSRLARADASRIIDALGRLRPTPAPAPAPSEPRMSPKQLHFIYFLLGRLGWLNEPGHTRNFLLKYFHVERVEKIQSRKQASGVIEALKAILKRRTQRESAPSAH